MPRPSNPHRRCIPLRGHRDETLRRARALVAALPADRVVQLSRRDEGATSPSRARARLGRSFDAVIVDLHDTLDANVLGQCHGLIRGGGAMILRLPPAGQPPQDDARGQVVIPYQEGDVAHRFFSRFERALGRAAPASLSPLQPIEAPQAGSEEQRRLVEHLAGRFEAADVGCGAIALLADRGRGKSSALGLALARALKARPTLRVALTANHVDALAEVFRFGVGAEAPPREGSPRFVSPEALIEGEEEFDLVVVDEAAQLPVPWLKRLARRHAGACLTFATTTHGYEGTGRGFTLRFLEWLGRERPVERLTLREPIRWAAGDPLERFVFDALLLDAELAEVPPEARQATELEVVAVELERDALAADEATLREVFGLLVQAHYRTTPNDLKRLLDAPNVRVHALRLGARGPVVAATLVALEGGLDEAMCEALLRGTSVRGHALAETLVTHMGRAEAGRLRMIRSVRIATHPALRRRGLAARLVEHVHDRYAPDLFGTLFGATPALLAFRRAVGYRLVRLSGSRGSRTGEPAAVMLRPCTKAARALVRALRGALARELPVQLELLQGDGLRLEPQMEAAALDGLPAPAPLSPEERRAQVARYAYGPPTFEATPTALIGFAEAHGEALGRLGWQERALIEGRALRRWSWRRVMAEARLSSLPATMRALRRAYRALFEAVGEGGVTSDSSVM